MPKVINDVGQSISVNNQGKGFGQDDDGHVALEAHLGQSSQHTEKVRWANWPNHHKNKETVKTIALIQPANVLIIGALADDRLNKGGSVETHQVKDNGATNNNTNIVINSSNNVTVDKYTCHRG